MGTELKLGKIIEGEAQRDAIHIAVAPVEAAEKLWPSMDVGLDGNLKAINTNCREYIGIVDPFLKNAVMPGERFYLWLRPNTVTGMRHEWQHPAFGESLEQPQSTPEKPMQPMQPDVAESVQWLTDFAETLDRNYEQMMADCRGYLDRGDYVTQYDSDSWRDAFYGSEQVFWDHYERVTGTKVPADDRGSPYSCSC